MNRKETINSIKAELEKGAFEGSISTFVRPSRYSLKEICDDMEELKKTFSSLRTFTYKEDLNKDKAGLTITWKGYKVDGYDNFFTKAHLARAFEDLVKGLKYAFWEGPFYGEAVIKVDFTQEDPTREEVEEIVEAAISATLEGGTGTEIEYHIIKSKMKPSNVYLVVFDWATSVVD